jgi:transcriptional regulator with XRE-family HTH domain
MLLMATTTLPDLLRTRRIPTRDIAAALDVSPYTVYAWRCGRQMPGPENVRGLARLLRSTQTKVRSACEASVRQRRATY